MLETIKNFVLSSTGEGLSLRFQSLCAGLFPLLLALLVKLSVMTPQTLKNYRRVAYALMVSSVALLPPTDGISLVAMTLPLVLLYEVTIILLDN